MVFVHFILSRINKNPKLSSHWSNIYRDKLICITFARFSVFSINTAVTFLTHNEDFEEKNLLICYIWKTGKDAEKILRFSRLVSLYISVFIGA
jgi:hypothetical protein